MQLLLHPSSPMVRRLFTALTLALLAAPPLDAQVTPRAALRARIDAILAAPLKAGTLAGAAAWWLTLAP